MAVPNKPTNPKPDSGAEAIFDRSQLLKGTLEGCVLFLLHSKVSYGYELLIDLQSYGFRDLSEGTVYPLLMRLEKKGWLKANFQPSPLGPSRKYFAITTLGEIALQEFLESWTDIDGSVRRLMKGEKDEAAQDT